MKTEKVSISEDKILNFIAWCYQFTHLDANLTSKAITAVISFHKNNSISFDRKQQASIRRLLDGYQTLRPPDKRIKLPLSEYHIQKIFVYCVDTNNYISLLPGCAVLI